jgi:alkylation response protein AidB-like acyl-CoA dehydrogenase
MTYEQIKKNIKDLAKSSFSKWAKICDQENRFPHENFELIKSENLQSILVPKEFGGAGLNFYEYQQCLVEIAKGCASTAAAFNMHNIVIGSLSTINLEALLPREKKRILPFLENIFQLVVTQKKIFAAATTEPGIGARFSLVKTNYQRTHNGYILNGKKSFVTMANYADYYLVLAKKLELAATSAQQPALSYFLVASKQKDIKINESWDVLGMRGTASHEVEFNNIYLQPEDLFMGQEGFALTKVMREPQWVTGGYLGVYLGIMEIAFEFTCDYIKARTDYQAGTGLGFQTLIQARVADMYLLLTNARNAVFDAAKKIDSVPGSDEANNAIYTAKYLVGEAAPELTSLAVRTCGGSTIHKQYDLERYHRDSMCGKLMPAVSDTCQIYLGKSMLGITEMKIW